MKDCLGNSTEMTSTKKFFSKYELFKIGRVEKQ